MCSASRAATSTTTSRRCSRPEASVLRVLVEPRHQVVEQAHAVAAGAVGDGGDLGRGLPDRHADVQVRPGRVVDEALEEEGGGDRAAEAVAGVLEVGGAAFQ